MRRWPLFLGVGIAAIAGFALAVVLRHSTAPTQGTAELPSKTSALDSLIGSGESLYWDGDFEGASRVWQDAHDRAVATQDEPARASALTWLGLAAFRLGE